MSSYDRLTPEQRRLLFVDEQDTIECNPCLVQPGIQNICRVIDANGRLTNQINEEASLQEFLFHCQETGWHAAVKFPLSWHIERLGSQIIWVRYQKNNAKGTYWTAALIAVPSGQLFINHRYPFFRKGWWDALFSLTAASKAASRERREIIADMVNDLVRHPEWFRKFFYGGDPAASGKL